MSYKQQVTDYRTQIYLPEFLMEFVRKTAKAEKISQAEVVRRAVMEKALKKRKNLEKRKKEAGEKFFKLAGIIKNGPRDLSSDHDKYLGKALWEEYRQNQKK